MPIYERDNAAEERDTAAERRDTATEERHGAAEERDGAVVIAIVVALPSSPADDRGGP